MMSGRHNELVVPWVFYATAARFLRVVGHVLLGLLWPWKKPGPVGGGVNVMAVPPCPSPAMANSLAVYWPSSAMLAVWTPSETVSVPLRLLAASVKLRWVWLFLVAPKVMSRRSISPD